MYYLVYFLRVYEGHPADVRNKKNMLYEYNYIIIGEINVLIFLKFTTNLGNLGRILQCLYFLINEFFLL